jgi:hypothetical protein
MAPRIGFYAFLGITQWQHLLDTFRYAAQNADYNCFIVDSVMRIGIPDDDWAQQGIAGSQFAQFAQASKSHVFLVIHENKSEGPMKGRIRGSKQWVDNANNVVRIEINQKKQGQLDDLEEKYRIKAISAEKHHEEQQRLLDTWDSKFFLMKQRWMGSQQNGTKALWFDRNSLQFRGHYQDPPWKPAEVWGIWQDGESEVIV